MTEKEKKANQAKDTGLALVLLCLLGALTGRRTLLITAVLLLVAAMTWPLLFAPASRLWFGLSRHLGAVVSKLLLGVVFYAIATPMGILRRLAGKDAMNRRGWKNGTGSVFVDRDHIFTDKDLHHPF